MTKEFRCFSYLKLDSSVVTSCTKTDVTNLAGDYFQFSLENRNFSFSLVHNVTIEESSFK